MPSLNTLAEKIKYFNYYLGFERIFGLPDKFDFEIKLANEQVPLGIRSYRSVQVRNRDEAYTIIEKIIVPGDDNATWREKIRQQMEKEEITAITPWLQVIRHDL